MNGFILAGIIAVAFLAGYLIRGAIAVALERKRAREIEYVSAVTANWIADKEYL
jgi:hypothetical protein